MDILDNHKTKTSTSIARIGTMQDMADLTSLCVNSDTVSMTMFSPKGPQSLYHQFLIMFIMTVNNCDWVDWFAKNGGNMPNLHWHLYVFLRGSSTTCRICQGLWQHKCHLQGASDHQPQYKVLDQSAEDHEGIH